MEEFSEEYDECYLCGCITNKFCPYCGTPYCEDCFEKINYKCVYCTSDNYE